MEEVMEAEEEEEEGELQEEEEAMFMEGKFDEPIMYRWRWVE